MFNLGGWSEVLIIAVAALVLLGPKELPDVLRACGRWMSRFRHLSAQLRQGVDNFLQEGELQEFEERARKKAQANPFDKDESPDDHHEPDSSTRC